EFHVRLARWVDILQFVLGRNRPSAPYFVSSPFGLSRFDFIVCRQLFGSYWTEEAESATRRNARPMGRPLEHGFSPSVPQCCCQRGKPSFQYALRPGPRPRRCFLQPPARAPWRSSERPTGILRSARHYDCRGPQARAEGPCVAEYLPHMD